MSSRAHANALAERRQVECGVRDAPAHPHLTCCEYNADLTYRITI